MKKSLTTLFLTVVLGLGASSAFGTTFAEYDALSKEGKNSLLTDRAGEIYTWLSKNDPAKAECMFEKFVTYDKSEHKGMSDALVNLTVLIAGVPDERRDTSKVEDLMVGYITKDLCKNASIKPVNQ